VRVGVIGLGNIGGAIAANLVADGHSVLVFDQDAARVRALAGAAAASAPEEVARASETCFLSLPTPAVVRAVAEQWLRGDATGSVLVDLSTNAPAAVRELGRAVFHFGPLGHGNTAKLVNSLLAFT